VRKFLSLIFLVLLLPPVFAETGYRKYNNLPQGTFKKNWKGDIVQYDKTGKKIGVYRIQNVRNGKIR